MKVNNKQLIIDVSDIDKSSFEALMYFGQDNAHTPIGKLVNEWVENVSWDVAAWYIGYDL